MAGGFIYIAVTGLIPEIKKELNIKKSMVTILVFMCGILIMWLTKTVFGGLITGITVSIGKIYNVT